MNILLSSVAPVSVDTHGLRKHIELITDNNGSTCLTISNEKPVQLVAEFTVNIPVDDESNSCVIIKVQLSSDNICESVMFLNLSPFNICTPAQKAEVGIGEILQGSIANHTCYYKVPVACHTNFCEAHGYLAFKTNARVEIKLCELGQG